MRQWHWFQFVSNGVLILFLGIIVLVIYVAFSRTSGSTGLDMSTIQKIRFDQYSNDPSQPTTLTP